MKRIILFAIVLSSFILLSVCSSKVFAQQVEQVATTNKISFDDLFPNASVGGLDRLSLEEKEKLKTWVIGLIIDAKRLGYDNGQRDMLDLVKIELRKIVAENEVKDRESKKGKIARSLAYLLASGVANINNSQQPINTASVYSPRPTPSTSGVIESRIKSNFSGFEYDRIYELDNGQIWKQKEYHIYYHYAYYPKVIIYDESGSYKMKVDGIDKAISVVRIK